MSFNVGDEVYFIRRGDFRVTKYKCPDCNGSGVLKGLKKGYPNLRCSCKTCHAEGVLEKGVEGCWIIGPNIIVSVNPDVIVVSSQMMLDDMKRKDVSDLARAFLLSATKYSWERVSPKDVFYSRDEALRKIIEEGGILVNDKE